MIFLEFMSKVTIFAVVGLTSIKYKISIFGMYAKWAKRCKMQKCYLYQCVHVSVCICISVCSVSFINLAFLVFSPNKPKSAKCEFLKKIRNLKSITDKCTIHPLWVAPV